MPCSDRGVSPARRRSTSTARCSNRRSSTSSLCLLNGRTVVAELTLTVLSEEPTWLWAMGYNFMADGFPDFFRALTSGPDGPMDMTGYSAAFNGPPPVSAESSGWGDLKALYR